MTVHILQARQATIRDGHFPSASSVVPSPASAGVFGFGIHSRVGFGIGREIAVTVPHRLSMTHSLLRSCAALISLGSLTLVTQASPASTPMYTPAELTVETTPMAVPPLASEAANASLSPADVLVLREPPPVVHPWRRLLKREVTPNVVANANAIIRAHHQIGEEVPFTVAGEQFLARIEEHYHPPGGDKLPWGPHPGVSVFVARPAVTP